jgi:hypothetical protein
MTDFYDAKIIVRARYIISCIVWDKEGMTKTSVGVKLTQKTMRCIDLEGVDFPIGFGEFVGIVVNNCDNRKSGLRAIKTKGRLTALTGRGFCCTCGRIPHRLGPSPVALQD